MIMEWLEGFEAVGIWFNRKVKYDRFIKSLKKKRKEKY